MLDVFRKSVTESWVLKAVLALIAFAFVISYGTLRGSQMEAVFFVNGDVISQTEWNDFTTRLQERLRSLGNTNVPGGVVRQQALDELIRSRLLTQEANRLGLMVSDAELRESIAADPAFQVEGRFDKRAYLRVLRANRFQPGDYQELQRRQMLMAKLQALVTAGAHATVDEARERYRYDNEQVSLRFIRVAAADLVSGVEVSQEDASNYYQTNKESFREPERVRIRYLYFSPEEFAGIVHVTDAQVEGYYDEHRDRYQGSDGPKELEDVRGRITEILTQQASGELALDRAENVYKQLLDGTALDKVAGSSGVKAETPPPFARGEMVVGLPRAPELNEAVFLSEPGEIGDIVTLESGYVIFQVTERIDSFIPELDAVRERVESVLRNKRASDLAHKRAETLLDRLQRKPNLKALADEEKLTVSETKPFSRQGSYIVGIGDVAALKEAAFHLSPEKPVAPAVYDEGDDAVIAALEKRLPADQKKFEEEKERVLAQIRRRRQVSIMSEFVNYLKERAELKPGRGYKQG